MSVAFRAVQWNRAKIVYDGILLTGVTLFIVGRPHSREETTAFPLRVTPRIGRQGGGVGLEGAW